MPRSSPLGTRNGSRSPVYQPGVLGAIARFWQIKYFLEPFHRMFSLDNLAIQYPHALVERVSSAWNVFYSGCIPLVILILWALIFRPGFHKGHVTILGFLISLFLTTFLTDVIKNAVGRPRPDLLARCKPAPGTPAHSLVTFKICTETDSETLHDGWRSFPSGHSSFAFSGLGYFAFFLAGQMRVLRPGTDLGRFLIALAPLLCAALIAISRCEDYRHDVYDVTCGSLLGILVAHFSYRRYYPPVRSRYCDTPYPSRSDVAGGFQKLKDDEEARIDSARDFEIEDLEDDIRETLPLRESSRDRRQVLDRNLR
ncbi:MAG: hypothetical protein M1834_002658 [Cirrosporium novae-zelandiae]|nr:MAG: hypothetical protein M1834_002658 [Cirrosporium novae-zelandiae]